MIRIGELRNPVAEVEYMAAARAKEARISADFFDGLGACKQRIRVKFPAARPCHPPVRA